MTLDELMIRIGDVPELEEAFEDTIRNSSDIRGYSRIKI